MSLPPPHPHSRLCTPLHPPPPPTHWGAQVEAATAQYELAVALQPGYVTAWNNLGDAHERQKRYAEALAAFFEKRTGAFKGR